MSLNTQELFTVHGATTLAAANCRLKAPNINKSTGDSLLVKRVFDKACKSYIVEMNSAGAAGVELTIPKDERKLLSLPLPFVAIQLFVPIGAALHFEITISDTDSLKRRLIFSTSFTAKKEQEEEPPARGAPSKAGKAAAPAPAGRGKMAFGSRLPSSNPPPAAPAASSKSNATSGIHAQLPLTTIQRNVWLNLWIDVAELTYKSFGTFFTVLESISISPACKLRKVIATKELNEYIVPKPLEMPASIMVQAQLLNSETIFGAPAQPSPAPMGAPSQMNQHYSAAPASPLAPPPPVLTAYAVSPASPSSSFSSSASYSPPSSVQSSPIKAPPQPMFQPSKIPGPSRIPVPGKGASNRAAPALAKTGAKQEEVILDDFGIVGAPSKVHTQPPPASMLGEGEIEEEQSAAVHFNSHRNHSRNDPEMSSLINLSGNGNSQNMRRSRYGDEASHQGQRQDARMREDYGDSVSMGEEGEEEEEEYYRAQHHQQHQQELEFTSAAQRKSAGAVVGPKRKTPDLQQQQQQQPHSILHPPQYQQSQHPMATAAAVASSKQYDRRIYEDFAKNKKNAAAAAAAAGKRGVPLRPESRDMFADFDPAAVAEDNIPHDEEDEFSNYYSKYRGDGEEHHRSEDDNDDDDDDDDSDEEKEKEESPAVRQARMYQQQLQQKQTQQRKVLGNLNVSAIAAASSIEVDERGFYDEEDDDLDEAHADETMASQDLRQALEQYGDEERFRNDFVVHAVSAEEHQEHQEEEEDGNDDDDGDDLGHDRSYESHGQDDEADQKEDEEQEAQRHAMVEAEEEKEEEQEEQPQSQGFGGVDDEEDSEPQYADADPSDSDFVPDFDLDFTISGFALAPKRPAAPVVAAAPIPLASSSHSMNCPPTAGQSSRPSSSAGLPPAASSSVPRSSSAGAAGIPALSLSSVSQARPSSALNQNISQSQSSMSSSRPSSASSSVQQLSSRSNSGSHLPSLLLGEQHATEERRPSSSAGRPASALRATPRPRDPEEDDEPNIVAASVDFDAMRQSHNDEEQEQEQESLVQEDEEDEGQGGADIDASLSQSFSQNLHVSSSRPASSQGSQSRPSSSAGRQVPPLPVTQASEPSSISSRSRPSSRSSSQRRNPEEAIDFHRPVSGLKSLDLSARAGMNSARGMAGVAEHHLHNSQLPPRPTTASGAESLVDQSLDFGEDKPMISQRSLSRQGNSRPPSALLSSSSISDLSASKPPLAPSASASIRQSIRMSIDASGGDEVELLFDPVLGLYFDPKTNKYFDVDPSSSTASLRENM